MKNITIKTKLIFLGIVVSFLFIISSVLIYVQLSGMSIIADRMVNVRMVSSVASSNYALGVVASANSLRAYVITKKVGMKEAREKEWNENINPNLAKLNEYSKNWTNPANKLRLDTLNQITSNFNAAQEKVASLIDVRLDYFKSHTDSIERMRFDATNDKLIQTTFSEELLPLFTKTKRVSTSIAQSQADLMKEDMALNQKTTETLKTLSIIISCAGIFIILVLMIWVIRSITIPLRELIDSLKRMSEGDLTVAIESNSKDEVGEALAAMKTTVTKLKEVIENVVSGAETIVSASTQVSSAAERMSQGATQQASSVEEVSSSMEQMAANIQQNTDNSKQTEKIATKAAKDIDNGNESVNKTVSSMKTIANKISIIGEISRQTNLLALNAAVEAARAGEHGRGFAVVAAEVRKLAERSQLAATEIDEVSKVSVDIAQKSGELLKEVVPNIQKTADLVQEISASSVEQNSGAEQINSAIQQLNQVIQENAASAEEMAANAEELSAQANRLNDAVAFFKTDTKQQGHIEKSRTKEITSAIKKSTASYATANLKNNQKVKINLDNLDVIDGEYRKF